MSPIAGYLMSVLCISILCGLCRFIAGDKQKILQVLLGVILLLVVISPLQRINLATITGLTDSFRTEADLIIENAEKARQDAIDSGIAEKLQSYIEGTAAKQDIMLTAQVEVSDNAICFVHLHSLSAPNEKRIIEKILQSELGITGEQIQWSS